jgi:hypothetical protein
MLSAIKGQPLRPPGYQLLTGTTIQLVTAALTEARCFEAKLPEIQQEPTMIKIVILLAVAFVLATGSVTILTGYPQPATDFRIDPNWSSTPRSAA